MMFASPASTTLSTSNGSTPSWSEWIEPVVYCASRIARGPNLAPGRWLTASSNGAPTIATSTFLARSSAASGTQGSFMNDGIPTYVGRSKSSYVSNARSQPLRAA
jgi:hypothetical protein